MYDAITIKSKYQYEKLLKHLEELGWIWQGKEKATYGIKFYEFYKNDIYVVLCDINKSLLYGYLNRQKFEFNRRCHPYCDYNFITFEAFMDKYKPANLNKEIIKLLNDKYK
jgi:hypothetical protein